MKRLCALLALLVALTACGGISGDPATAGSLDKPEGLPLARVTWIYDGDTVVVDEGGETTIRLVGINSPDRGECFYDESTRYLIDTLKNQTVAIDEVGDDQYGRTLAYLWLEDDLVNLGLVAAGYAIATTTDEGRQYGADLIEAEEEAFSAKAGLWGPGSCGLDLIPEGLSLEVAADPPGPDDQVLESEHVTITNTSGSAVNLAGWTLRDESSAHRYRFGDATIGSGESYTVSSADDGWDPGGSPVWNNGGDMALLLNGDGAVVARARYP